MGGEGLARRPADVLATLLHEALNALAHCCGVKDIPRQGWCSAYCCPGFPPSAGEALPVTAARVSPRKSDAGQVVARPWRLMALSNAEQQGFRLDVQVDAALLRDVSRR